MKVLEASKGAYDYFLKPWRSTAWQEERQSLLFAYKSPNRW